MGGCKCSFSQKTQGDGCEICNPSLALDHAKDRIEELEDALELITRECDALNKGPVAVEIARKALNGPS